jgi:hypothetical protein
MDVSSQILDPAALPLENSPGTHWRMGGTQKQSGHLGEDQHLFAENNLNMLHICNEQDACPKPTNM